MAQPGLDDPSRIHELRSLIARKKGLRLFYDRCYQFFIANRRAAAKGGLSIELGAGASYLNRIDPAFELTDIIEYEGIDRVVDGLNMPFDNNSVSIICMMNVLHHIPDCRRFFSEVDRVLKVGGRLALVDQYPGTFSKYILKYAHHEPFDDKVEEWEFPSRGPLSSANGALAHNIFFRDYKKFCDWFPNLKVITKNRHSPLLYWYAGGLKNWELPAPRIVEKAEKLLLRANPNLASFVDIVVEKVK